MLLKNFIVSLASGVATSASNNSSNPLYRKTTYGNNYKINEGSLSSIDSVSGSIYNTKGSNGIATIGRYRGIVLGTGTTPLLTATFK